jgi:hypothetical protein
MNLNNPENAWKAAVKASEKRSYSSVANLHAANPNKQSIKELENLYMENIKLDDFVVNMGNRNKKPNLGLTPISVGNKQPQKPKLRLMSLNQLSDDES